MFIGLIFPSAPFQILSNNQEEGKKKAQCPDNVKHEAQARRPWLSCQHWSDSHAMPK
jgi:hypothetical protein